MSLTSELVNTSTSWCPLELVFQQILFLSSTIINIYDDLAIYDRKMNTASTKHEMRSPQ